MQCFEFLGRSLMVASSGDLDDAVELEPIVVMKPHPEPDAELDSVAVMWKSNLQYTPQTRFDNISRRRVRSRSSPVRAVEDERRTRVRTRSPSVFSPRPRNKGRPRERVQQCPGTDVSPEYALDSSYPSEDCLKTSNSYWFGPSSSCGSAYFSLRPPAAPLRLVPIVTPSRPPMAPTVYSGVMDIARVSFTKKGHEDCENTVCGFLRELVASLPLQTNSTIIQTLHSANVDPVTPSRSCGNIRHASMLTYPREDRDQLQRSIATQAKNKQDHDAFNGQQSRTQAAPPDEWLGGVRALRDSHVRLVLRQLRHIKRLNRALDRAVRSPPPPPSPTSPRAAPACASDAAAAHAQV